MKYSGTVSGNQILSSQKSMTDDGRFDGMRELILDASCIEENTADENYIKLISAVANAQSKTNPFIRNAVILNSSEDGQALAAYYQSLAESTGWDIELFKTEAEARSWLKGVKG